MDPEENMQFGPVMLDLDSYAVSQSEMELLQHPNVGGVILFSRNYDSPAQLHDLVSSIRSIRNNILISVDQEGGRVQRFKNGFITLPALRGLGHYFNKDKQSALEHAKILAQLMASELLEYKIDFSFAPVLDIDYGRSEVIGNRAFHSNVEAIVALSNCYIDGLHTSGMAAIGKHFPGHGFVRADSHTEVPIDDRSKNEIINTDMRIFKELAGKLDGIMPAHVIYSMLDSAPAGFSQFWLQEILRKELKFTGVIFSDDLNMEGAKQISSDHAERAIVALKSGCDIVLICNNRPAAEDIINSIPVGSYSLPYDSYKRLRAKRVEKTLPKGSEQWTQAVSLAEKYCSMT